MRTPGAVPLAAAAIVELRFTELEIKTRRLNACGKWPNNAPVEVSIRSGKSPSASARSQSELSAATAMKIFHVEPVGYAPWITRLKSSRISSFNGLQEVKLDFDFVETDLWRSRTSVRKSGT